MLGEGVSHIQLPFLFFQEAYYSLVRANKNLSPSLNRFEYLTMQRNFDGPKTQPFAIRTKRMEMVLRLFLLVTQVPLKVRQYGGW